ncbi:hypothetical protein DIC78_08860 [Bacillus halotolerans]|nr:hypothetical protein DIC78_08860 [Bacillus halotolerans]
MIRLQYPCQISAHANVIQANQWFAEQLFHNTWNTLISFLFQNKRSRLKCFDYFCDM